jgi:hypothetical protein
MATLVDEGEVPKCPDPNVNPAGYLRSIHAVRERCMIVFEKARKNELNHFDVDWDKFDQTVKWVEQIIRVCIPAHGFSIRILASLEQTECGFGEFC